MPETEKIYDVNSIGFKLKFVGPATVEDYDRVAGVVGTCLEDAISNVIYRGTLPEWHAAFAEKVEAITGSKREVNAEQTAKNQARAKEGVTVPNVLETVPKYVKRALASADDSQRAQIQAAAQAVADTIKVDPSPSKRQSGPGKDLLAKADSWLTLDETAREEKVTKMLNGVPGFDLERDEENVPERASLARLIGEYLSAM